MASKQATIFLDCDGVLNSVGAYLRGGTLIDQECVNVFNSLLSRIYGATGTDPKIVVSSAWRYLVSGGAMTCRGFEYMLRTHGLQVVDMIRDITPADEDIEGRGRQIRAWLNENGGADLYVVLDDTDEGISDNHKWFVRTNSSYGIRPEDADKALKMISQQMEAR